MDPCFGCMDRIAVVEVGKDREWTVRGAELRKFGIEWYKERAGR
jgi:hypothetical protein